jgi:hypothetical protein
MFLRSRGWLWTATVFQALVQALHGQTAASSPALAPSSSAMQPVSPRDPDEWNLEPPTLEQQTPVPQEPQSGSETGVAPQAPFEQEPGWSGELNNPRNNEFELPPSQLPVDPRAAGLKLSLGPIDIRPVFIFSAMYDDNIDITNTNRKADLVYTLSPGVFVGLGDYIQREANFIRFVYVPALQLFQHFHSDDTLNQHLRLEGQYAFSRLKLSSYFEYDSLTGPNRDIGGRVTGDTYRAGLNAAYLLSDKTSLDITNDVTFQHYKQQSGYEEFVNHDWFNYHLASKLYLGLGTAFGALHPDPGGTQPYQQGLFRIQFASTPKLTFSGNAGFEVREFPSTAVSGTSNRGTNASQFSGSGTRVTPVFGLSANYEFLPGSTFSLSGDRYVTNSSSTNLAGDNFTATLVSGKLTQHLIGNYFLGLGAGYENDAYSQAISATTGQITQRQDNYFYIQPSITYHWKDLGDISVSYERRVNSSNQSNFSFRDNQVWVQFHIGF